MRKKTQIFLMILILSSFAVGGAGLFLQRSLLEPLGIATEEHPVALPFVLLADEILQAQVESALEESKNPPVESPATEPPVTEATTIPTEVPTEVPAEATTEPPTEAPTEPAGPVEDSWFDDALFIGESRVQGMKHFCRLGNADYFCAASMTTLGVLDAKLSDETFTDYTLEQLLTERTYGKVLIHLGINELRLGAQRIVKEYTRIIDQVLSHQPDAVIVLLGCMSVTEGYADIAGLNLDVVHELNALLRETAEQEPERYRYVDTNSWAADEDGFLRMEVTRDGCHLYVENYADWCNLIKEEAGNWNIP